MNGYSYLTLEQRREIVSAVTHGGKTAVRVYGKY